MSTDLFSLSEVGKAEEPPAPSPEEEAEAMARLLASAAEAEEGPKKSAPKKPVRRKSEEHHFELSANAIDLDSILGDFDDSAAGAHAVPHDVEVDLSIVLDDIKPGQAAPRPAATAGPGRGPRVGLRQHARPVAPLRSGRRGEGVQARAGAAESGRHRRLHRGADQGVAGAEAALRHLVADRPALPRPRHDARRRSSGSSAPRRRRRRTPRTATSVLYELADRWSKPASRRARSPSAWSSSRMRPATATSPSGSID